MIRLLVVLAAFALVGIALLWRASLPTPAAQPVSTSHAAHATAEQDIVLPLAPVERAVLATAPPVEALTTLVDARAPTVAVAPPSERTFATAMLEVIAVASGTGAPIEGASIKVSSMGADVSRDARSLDAELLTDASGSVFAEVPADQQLNVHVVVGEARVWQMVGPLAPGVRRRLDVEIVTNETSSVVVRVLAAESDALIAGARIAIEDSDETYTAAADGLASFELEAATPWTALVDADGYAARRVQLADGRSSGAGKITVRLRRSASLAVRVLDERGSELSDCTVALTAPGYWIQDSTTYIHGTKDLRFEADGDAFGVAYFENLPPEVPFALAVKRKRKVELEGGKPVTLAAGEAREMEVRIGGGVDIAGRLLDQDGEPVVGHEVWLVPDDGDASRPFFGFEDVTAKATTKGDGAFEFRDVAPGPWLVGPGAREMYSHDELDPNAVVGMPELVVMASGDSDRELILRAHRGLTIEGRVVDPNGEPVSDVLVSAGSGSASTDEHGAFRVGPLLPGEYDLWVNAAFTGWAPPERRRVEAGARDVVIELLRGGGLLVKVRDASGRLVSAGVVLSRGEDFLTLGEASGGSTEFSGLSPGSYALAASTSESCAVEGNAAVEVGRTTEIELVLATAAHLTVRYVGQGAYGQLRVWYGDIVAYADGVAKGTSVVCCVPPGALRVVMTGNGGPEERVVDVRAGELTEIVFE